MLAATWGTGQVVLDILWFFLFLIQIWLMISIFMDVFRRHDMKGWLKAFWVVLVIVLPLVGIVLYLIMYGDQMRVHVQQTAEQQQRMFRDYVRDAAGTTSAADELEHLAALRDRGVINEEEFQRMKDRIVAGHTGAAP